MNVAFLLERYASVARPIIRQYYRADSCIASTAITIGVLKMFDVPAKPFPCRMLIFNRAFVERIERENRFPTAQETIEWTSDGKAWSIGVGMPSPDMKPNAYVGHLTAIVADQWLVDASADQATRPEKNLFLPGVLVSPVTRDFRRCKDSLKVTSSHGDIAMYEPRPKDRAWLQSPNWTAEHQHIVGEIYQAMISL